MASNTVYLPTEITELMIDELGVDGSSDDGSRAALRTCLFVSQQFHQRARSHLFRNIVLHDGYVHGRIPFFRNRLILLQHLLTTSINDHDPGIASNIRKLTISVSFEDSEPGSAAETEQGGGEENSIAEIVTNYFPPILELIRRDAYRLKSLVIEDRYSWPGCEWASLSLDLHLALRGLLCMRTLRHLKLRNFFGVPYNLFDGIQITHLTIYGLEPLDTALEIDESISVPPPLKEITFPPLELLDTDQSFPLERIVDISAQQSPDTSQTKLLKKIKIQVYNKFDLTNVVDLLRAAYLAEDLHVDFMGLQSNPSPIMNLDLLPLQKLTHLTMSYRESLDVSTLVQSGPKPREIAYSILKSRSYSIEYLTLEFKFKLPNDDTTPDYLIYLRQEDWEPFDNLLAGSHYPKLCQLELRITLSWGSTPDVQTAIENCRNRFKDAFPLLSASDRLRLYLA